MGTKVTVTLPDELYRQVETVARQARRSVPDVVADVLAQAFPAVYVSPQRQQMEHEQQAYERLHGDLVRQYEGQYVAIHGGQLIDHDPDQSALVRRLDAHYPNEVVHVRQVSSEVEEPVLRARSPRLID